jgi:hypothetical protein
LFQVEAVLVAALALGALAWDIIAPPARGGTPASQQGQGIGFIIGAALRTILLVVLAAFLRAKARSLADPNAFNPRTELREIAAALSGHVVAETAGAEGTYSDCTDEELVDVYRSIRREAVPSRFDELVCEIRRRTSA